MIEFQAWIFTLSSILAYLIMVFHSIFFYRKSVTLFIFGGTYVLSFLMEYILSVVMELYTYKGLPITVLSIPLSIPCGWIITYYGLIHLSNDIVSLQSESKFIITTFSGILAIIFGLGIETLARNVDFWTFHFTSKTIFGVPYIVPLAWGLTIANFSGMTFLFEKYPKLWLIILPSIHLVNIVIANVLLLLI